MRSNWSGGRALAGALAIAAALLPVQAAALPPPVGVVPMLGQSPERQLRDSRVCEVWATRKSGAGSDSGFVDVAVGSVEGLFGGWEIGAYFGSAQTGALVGAGVGAGLGAVQAMGKQTLRTRIYADCMVARGYEVYTLRQ